MNKTLEELIEEAVSKKKGNQEFALFYFPAWKWRAALGNPSSFVGLGESEGELEAEGVSAKEVVQSLIDQLDG